MKPKINDEDTITKIVNAVFITGICLIVLCGLLGCAQAWWLYADKPITEIPAWALWFLFGGNR